MDTRTLPRRPRAAAALLVLALALGLAGCGFETPQTDRAKDQAKQVLADAGVAVTALWFDIGEYPASGPNQVTAVVTLDPATVSDGMEAATATIASTLWRKAIVQLDAIQVMGQGSTPSTTSSTATLLTKELVSRYGERPAGLVQIDGATLKAEDDELNKSIIGIIFALGVLPMLLMLVGVVLVIGVVVLVIVLVTRRRPPTPPPPPGWPGSPYQA
jgi:hypothetical protein